MGHTFTNNLYHIIFSTKGRQPFLHDDLRDQLFAYIGGVARNKGGILLKINAVEDHLHLLLKIPPDIAVATLVAAIKANSSRWIGETFPQLRDFSWQAGYSSFTVSESLKEGVARYIASQPEHHKKRSFEDELALLLQKNWVPYDPKHYVD